MKAECVAHPNDTRCCATSTAFILCPPPRCLRSSPKFRLQIRLERIIDIVDRLLESEGCFVRLSDCHRASRYQLRWDAEEHCGTWSKFPCSVLSSIVSFLFRELWHKNRRSSFSSQSRKLTRQRLGRWAKSNFFGKTEIFEFSWWSDYILFQILINIFKSYIKGRFYFYSCFVSLNLQRMTECGFKNVSVVDVTEESRTAQATYFNEHSLVSCNRSIFLFHFEWSTLNKKSINWKLLLSLRSSDCF